MNYLDIVPRLSKYVEEKVCITRDLWVLRRYYRFRPSKNYGGSAVGYIVGCNLSCVYCWCKKINTKPWIGSYELPNNVVEKLLSIARARGYNVVRLSGGEPTLCFNHLIQVINLFSYRRKEREIFILETNGLLLGLNEDLSAEFKPYSKFLVVRISLKGCTEEDFEKITSLNGFVYSSQVKAIENLSVNNIPYIVAIPISLCSRQGLSRLLEVLTRKIGEHILNVLEQEVLILYPSVVDDMCRKNLKPWIAYDPVEKKKIKGDEVDELFKRRCREID
ncbi:MAG: radical SAM protein [Ignisphaera sp.]